jgi:hypothetical protein
MQGRGGGGHAGLLVAHPAAAGRQEEGYPTDSTRSIIATPKEGNPGEGRMLAVLVAGPPRVLGA